MDWREPLKFIAVGLISLAINYAVFRGIFSWLSGGAAAAVESIPLTASHAAAVATAGGYSAGVTNGFFLNRAWTFKVPPASGQVQRFVALNLFSLALGSLGVAVLVDRLGLAVGLAWFVATAVTTALNFVGSKHWAFAR